MYTYVYMQGHKHMYMPEDVYFASRFFFLCGVISPRQDSRIAWWNVRPGDRSRACKVSDASQLDPDSFLWS